jgi:hypothetical protein
MANTIKIKNSGTASNVPASLEFGELGLNYADGKLYYKNASNNIVQFSASTNLDGLSDVVITSPEEFQSLSYNGTTWVNGHIPVVSYVRNAESTTLTTGTVVYLFGSTGDHATVKRADNDSDATSSKTVGLVAASIAASENGPVVTRGYVDGIDLSVGYTAGDVLWLGEDGAFTKIKPTAPEHLVFIGVVVRATNNGIVYVATQNGYELDELHDVSIVDKTSGDFLKYNGTLWVNDQINLGTDTTGNYVASLVAGSGITLSNNSGEGATPTVALTSNSLTVNGTSIALGGSGTITANASTLTGTSLNSSVTGSSLTSVGTLTSLSVSGNVSVTGAVVDHVVTNQQTASYTLALTDDGDLVEMNVGTANNLTVPADNTVNFPIGTSIDILQVGAGQTTIVAASGVTINRATGLKLRAQWSAATIIKRAANTWVAIGDLSA